MPKPFELLGLAMGLKFLLPKPFQLLGLAMGQKIFTAKTFLAAGPGYGIFLDSRVLSFSRACMRVHACACICVRARKAFWEGVGGIF